MTDISVVGTVGFNAAKYSKEYLGYLAYIYLIALLYPLYKLNFSFIDKLWEKIIAVLFLVLSVIISQSLVVDNNMSGKIGDIIVEEISPFIGLAGLWIFVLLGFVISTIILVESLERSISLKFSGIKNPFKGAFEGFAKKENPRVKKDLEFEKLRRKPVSPPTCSKSLWSKR